MKRNRVRNWYIRWAHQAVPARIDRSRMYLWVHVGLAVVGVAIVLRPEMVGLPLLSLDANRILGSLVVWGSVLCVLASCMGVGKFFRDANTDLRTPYGCAVFGQLSVVTSLGFYLYRLTFVAHLPWPQLMGLGLSFAIMCALIHIDCIVIKEIWRLQHFKSHPTCQHWAQQ